jgi:hypothetical protein
MARLVELVLLRVRHWTIERRAVEVDRLGLVLVLDHAGRPLGERRWKARRPEVLGLEEVRIAGVGPDLRYRRRPPSDHHRSRVECTLNRMGSTQRRRWIFDVDGCVIDSLTGTSLRPGARDLLLHLSAASATVVWWSAGGEDYARRRAKQLGVDHLVDEFGAKTNRGQDGRWDAAHVTAESDSAVFVDDRPEDLPVGAVVVSVRPYISHNPHDRGLSEAARYAGATEISTWP